MKREDDGPDFLNEIPNGTHPPMTQPSPPTPQWSVAETGIAGGAPLRCYSA